MNGSPLVLFLAAALAASAEDVQFSPRLIAESDTVAPGGTVTVAITLDLPAGWHTYWRNPGDAGLAPDVTWQLPAGFKAGPLQWPFPVSIGKPPVLSYGYEGQMTLLCDVTAPKTLKPGETVSLKAKFSYMVCREACVPKKADLACALKVRPGGALPASPRNPLFAQARKNLPVEDPAWRFRYGASEEDGLLLLVAPPDDYPRDNLATARFFCYEPATLAESPGKWDLTGYSARLSLKGPPPPKTGRVKGVLVLDPENEKGIRRAFSVDVPVYRKPPPQ